MRVDRKELKEVLAKASKVEKKPGIPVLSGFLVRARTDGVLEITSTDLTLFYRGRVLGAEKTESWEAVIPRKAFAHAVDIHDEDTIELSPVGELDAQVGDVTLRTLAAADFPALPPEPENIGWTDGVALRKAYEAVRPAISKDQARPILTGLLLEFRADGMGLTGTDSYRIHHRELAGTFSEDTILVEPAVGAAFLAQPTKGEKPLGIGVLPLDRKQLYVVSGTDSWWVRSIEGTYPEFRTTIIEKLTPPIGKVGNTEKLVTAVKAAQKFGGDLDFMIFFEDSKAVVQSSKPDLGIFKREVEHVYFGQPTVYGVNAAYLLDALGAFEGPLQVQDGARLPIHPALVGDETDYAVLMPIKVPDHIREDVVPGILAQEAAEREERKKEGTNGS